MRNLKFHYARARNIMCFGPEGVEFRFENFGNIVQICGINLDAPATEDEPASNGSGKSSVPEIISVALYGRTIKSPTKNKAGRMINIMADEGEVEVQWDDFRVVRSYSRNKNGTVSGKLEMWESSDKIWDKSTKLDLGTGSLETEIEKKVGLSHHAFCNVMVFDDSNTYSFLEADLPTKRQIVENLLDLSQYRDYHENAKGMLRDIKKQIEVVGKSYALLKDDISACDRRILTMNQQEKTWKAIKEREVQDLVNRIKDRQNKLESTDIGLELAQWQKSQERISLLTDEIGELESKRIKAAEGIASAKAKVEIVRKDKQEISETIQSEHLASQTIKEELNKVLRIIGDIENLKDGMFCPTCYGTVNRANYAHVLDHSKATAEKCQKSLSHKLEILSTEKDKFGKKSATVSVMEEKIAEVETKVLAIDAKIRGYNIEISQLSKIPKPTGDSNEKVLEAEISELKRQAKLKVEELEGQSPYKEIIEQAQAEKAQKQFEHDQKAIDLATIEAEVPYYEFWIDAFSDNGIRKFVIDGVTPALNDRIYYWLQILIDGLIEVKFDNTLEESIVRKGNTAHYSYMSRGELRRINLAVSQSFAYVMMLNSGCCPSLVFLDEITGGGIDRAGVPYVYKMILELAKERQVFVTTHNENLMSLLQGCETITLKKSNDITTLAC